VVLVVDSTGHHEVYYASKAKIRRKGILKTHIRADASNGRIPSLRGLMWGLRETWCARVLINDMRVQ